jgi:4-amino-4-deoxy-L-arabinose transferase-like glycosyltransferase
MPIDAERRVTSRLRRAAPWLAALAALSWGALYLATSGDYDRISYGEEKVIAEHLARGEGFRSPFDTTAAAPLTSWSPPVYPFLISLAYRVFGFDSPGAPLAMSLFNTLCFALAAAALVLIARVYLPAAAGVIAVALFCLHPSLTRFVTDSWDGLLSLALFLLAVALVASWRERPESPRHAVTLGALLGLLSLTNAAYLLTYPLLVWSAFKPATLPRKLRLCAISLFSFALVLAPWTFRNWEAFGRIFYVRAGAQLELWNGNRPGRSGWLSDAALGHPFWNAPEKALVLKLGEISYFQLCGDRFREELRGDTKAFVGRSVVRGADLFFGRLDPARKPVSVSLRESLQLVLFSCLGLFGAAWLWRERRAARWLIVVAILSVAPFVITSASDRYAMPLRTLLALFAAAALAALHARLRARWTTAKPEPARALQ